MKFILLALVVCALAAPTEDLVDPQAFRDLNIPYAGKMYSGYFDITPDASKRFHYFFFPAYDLAGLKATIPVILWLNGGPGCSSLFGALNENGPFVFNLGTNTMRKNEWSWTNFANMLYLESPAGVGFSYGEGVPSDEQTGKDNLQAVIQFLKKFPEYQSVDFYISGESYAGTYIPILANEIIDYNAKQENSSTRIPLKGVMIGNGCTDPSECTIEAKKFPIHKFEFLYNHNMITQKLWDEIDDNRDRCNNNDEAFCQELYRRTAEEVHGEQSFYFNPYNVYGKCYTRPTMKFNGEVIPTSKLNLSGERQRGTVPECSEAQGLFYLFTNPAVRKAFNIVDESKEWVDCSDDIYADYQKDPRATYHLYPKLIKNDIRILKFSGDVDGVVPITGTLYWLDKMQKEQDLPTLENWRAWFINGERQGEDQNAGNVMVVDGIWFVSVRNAGHMVPMDQPQAASVMISYFIYNIPLPTEID